MGWKLIGFAAKYAAEAHGKEIEPTLTVNMTYLMTNKLAVKAMSEVLDMYDMPKNCQSIILPKVNAPIWDGMKMSAKNTDMKIQKMQKVLVKRMTEMTPDLKEPTHNQQNAQACFASANFEANMLRRKLTSEIKSHRHLL